MSEAWRRQVSVPAQRDVTIASLIRRIEYGDLLLLFYAAVFFRQFAWPISNQGLAWALTAALSLGLWLVYLSTKPEVKERTPQVFWLVVLLPLVLIFALRAPFPDLSFDVLNQRLLQGERGLRGPPFLPNDFFPMVFPHNPSSDMLTGMFRHFFGYRLGTVINLLVLLWTGTIIEKILRPFVKQNLWRCVCVVLLVFTEHLLFEINNYMVDLLALPLELEALRLALQFDKSGSKRRDLLFAAVLLGASIGLKLTNAPAVVPIAAVFAVRVFAARRDRALLAFALVACVLFLAPLLPHAFYIWRETGSPVFPLYNKIIKSPMWPDSSPYDGRWGPHDWIETFLWNWRSLWVPQRLSELNVYSGRFALAFVAAPLCLLLPRIGSHSRLIAAVVLLGSLMWSATSGYIRYGLFFEIAGGLLLVLLARYAWVEIKKLPRLLKVAAAGIPLCLLVLQCAFAAVYVRRTEWGGRPTILDTVAEYRHELRWIGRDRDLVSFQPAENKDLFAKVDAWVVSSVKSNGVEALLRPDVPALGVVYLEYFEKPAARQRFASAVEALHGKRIYSLTLNDELDASLDALRRRRLRVGEIKSVRVPFFSDRTSLHMFLIEVGPPEKLPIPRRAVNTPAVTEATGPLNDDAFMVELSVLDAPTSMRPDQAITIHVVVKNLSETVWPSLGRKDHAFLINLSDIWLAADGMTLVNNLDGRNNLPHDLWPGESVEVTLNIKAPRQPGEYVLEIGMVQEAVAFFKDKGAATWRARIKVQ